MQEAETVDLCSACGQSIQGENCPDCELTDSHFAFEIELIVEDIQRADSPFAKEQARDRLKNKMIDIRKHQDKLTRMTAEVVMLDTFREYVEAIDELNADQREKYRHQLLDRVGGLLTQKDRWLHDRRAEFGKIDHART